MDRKSIKPIAVVALSLVGLLKMFSPACVMPGTACFSNSFWGKMLTFTVFVGTAPS